MFKLAALTTAMLLTTAVHAQDDNVIFDTFWERFPDELFNCCQAYPLVGGHGDGGWSTIELPFVVEHETTLGEVDIALSLEGTSDHSEDDVQVLKRSDREVIYQWQQMDVPRIGQCCVFQALVVQGKRPILHPAYYLLKVRGRGQYEKRETGWNENTAGIRGTFIQLSANGRLVYRDALLPAVRILAMPSGDH